MAASVCLGKNTLVMTARDATDTPTSITSWLSQKPSLPMPIWTALLLTLTARSA